MSDSESQNSGVQSAPNRSRRLWPWFVVGFLGAFLAIAYFGSGYFLTHQGVYRVPLGRYYALEWKRVWNGNQGEGPASGSALVAAKTFGEHVLLSGVGGTLLAAVGWSLSKLRRK